MTQQSLQSLHLEAGKWSPPPLGVLKINFDRAVFKSEGCSDVGVVIKDWIGSFILGYSRRVQGILQFDHVEALAATTTIKMAIDSGYMKIALGGSGESGDSCTEE